MSYHFPYAFPESTLAARPLPGSLPVESLWHTAPELGHYRRNAAGAWVPLDAERGKFNTRDFPNIQACIDAAVDYSQNSPAAVAYGWQVPAIVEIDEAILAETMLGAINVTIPGNANLVFRGKDGWYGYVSLNITITGTASDFNYLAFDSVINYGTITTPGSLELWITDGGQFGNVAIAGRLWLTASNAYLGGVWTFGDVGYLQIDGGTSYANFRGACQIGANVRVTGGRWRGNGNVPTFDFLGAAAGRQQFSAMQVQIGQLYKCTGASPENLAITDCRMLEQGNGASVLPFIEIGNAGAVNIQNNYSGNWNMRGFADIASASHLTITGNSMNCQAAIAGSTAPIRIGAIGANAVVSNNICGKVFPHLLDLPAAAAAKTTAIGNRANFTTALATNAPAIALGNI